MMKLYGSKRNWNFLEEYRTKQNGGGERKQKAAFKKIAHRTARRTAKQNIEI